MSDKFTQSEDQMDAELESDLASFRRRLASIEGEMLECPWARFEQLCKEREQMKTEFEQKYPGWLRKPMPLPTPLHSSWREISVNLASPANWFSASIIVLLAIILFLFTRQENKVVNEPNDSPSIKTFSLSNAEKTNRKLLEPENTKTNEERKPAGRPVPLRPSPKRVKQKDLKLDANIHVSKDPLYAMLGVTRADVDAFDKELADMEKRVVELQHMTYAELLNHRDEIQRMNTRLGEMAKSKIALIPRYRARMEPLQGKVNDTRTQ